jgi:hypothetical protein
MATIIKSVSITEEEQELIDELNLSASGLLKEKLQEIKEMHNKTRIKLERVLTVNRILEQKLLEAQEELRSLKK